MQKHTQESWALALFFEDLLKLMLFKMPLGPSFSHPCLACGQGSGLSSQYLLCCSYKVAKFSSPFPGQILLFLSSFRLWEQLTFLWLHGAFFCQPAYSQYNLNPNNTKNLFIEAY